LNTLKRENKKKVEEKAAKAEKAVASMFGAMAPKKPVPTGASNIFGQ